VHHPSEGNHEADTTNDSASGPAVVSEKKLRIRDRLRLWEKDNPSEAQTILTDASYSGELSNTFTRPQNVTMAQFDVAPPLFEGDELSDLRSSSANLQPGDLVEMRYGLVSSFLLPPVNTI
jgi:hypothetical protein